MVGGRDSVEASTEDTGGAANCEARMLVLLPGLGDLVTSWVEVGSLLSLRPLCRNFLWYTSL